ncbi:right-handed parallel beta-helix repeat-containing protein [Leifsonia sp. 2TAF2]|uniref:NosD domain-containing protein n=1 Tax=Leifsonia sp. 2TAF2 TaxID=3233009 RepID=UPI003F9D8F8B
MTVGADGIDINLDGHTLAGSDTSPSVGVDIGSHSGTAIHDGTVRGFAAGASLNGAHSSTISRTVFINPVVVGIQLVNSDHNTIRSTRVTRDDTGDPDYAGLLLFHSDYNVITLNNLTRNGDGVSLDAASHNTIVGNTSSDSGSGIALVNNSTNNTLTANRTDRNFDSGILLDQHADANRIALNTAASNGFGGVVVGASDHNSVLLNTTNQNAGSGVVITDNAQGTTVQGNRANGNGFTPPGCTPDCPLLNDGIHIDAAPTIVRLNFADGNADLGIDAARGVIDRGGNEAHGNMNPLRCVNVLCRR